MLRHPNVSCPGAKSVGRRGARPPCRARRRRSGPGSTTQQGLHCLIEIYDCLVSPPLSVSVFLCSEVGTALLGNAFFSSFLFVLLLLATLLSLSLGLLTCCCCPGGIVRAGGKSDDALRGSLSIWEGIGLPEREGKEGQLPQSLKNHILVNFNQIAIV